jgi:hypothetical protein
MLFGEWKNALVGRVESRFWNLFPVIIVVGLLLFPGKGFGEDLGLSPLRWGLNLEDMNRLYQEKVNPQGELKADLQRFEIDLQIQPRKSVKIPRGGLVALVETPKGAGPSGLGRLFGYLWEGKFFGRVLLFRDHPPLTLPEAAQRLKTIYPEGRLFRQFTGTTMSHQFELDSAQMRIFLNDQGVFFYDPAVLKIVLQETEREKQDLLEKKGERIFLERGKGL